MSSKIFVGKILTFLLVFLTFFTRFYKLDWGQGNFFHPDENNMASAITRMTPNDLDPKFYAYGQFPLFLGYYSILLIKSPVTFEKAIISLRVWSAIFSSLSVLSLFLISCLIFTKKSTVFVATILAIFNPGLIQLSHFGTTESFLIFVFITNIYLAIKYNQKSEFKYLLLASLITGLGLATKITALILTGPIYLAIFFTIIKSRKILTNILLLLIFTLIFLMVFIVASPYNVISNKDFLSTINYETSVALGTVKVFYTNQFSHTTPYLFQLTNIFPYTSGLILFVVSMLGFGLLTFRFFLSKKSQSKKCTLFRQQWLLIIIPAIVYFSYNGQLYTKWTRFVSPLFILTSIIAANIFDVKLLNRYQKTILLIICLIPGVLFTNLYFKPDIRIVASDWINQNLEPNSTILSEAGNVLNIPFGSRNFAVTNFDFYNLDNNPKLQQELPTLIEKSKYILVPSRRMFKNQSGPEFPFSSRYYQALFSGSLGFTKIMEFKTPLELFLNSENAEETWSVFDHPTIRVFQKNQQLDLADYQAIIKQ